MFKEAKRLLLEAKERKPRLVSLLMLGLVPFTRGTETIEELELMFEPTCVEFLFEPKSLLLVKCLRS